MAKPRPFREFEVPLVQALFEKAELDCEVSQFLVTEMDDGEMGSMLFETSKTERRLGRNAAECEFFDSDGVTVSVVLNLDHDGDPFEIDVWKTSFEPLLKWPTADQLRFAN